MGERNEHLSICFVALSFWPSVGGAQRRAEKQARQLRDLGHDVLVVTLRLHKQWERRTHINGIPVVRVGGTYKRDGTLRIGRLGIWPVNIGVFLLLWRLRRSYDVIHVFQVTPLAAVAALIGKFTRKPVVVSSQCSVLAQTPRAQPESAAVLMADTLTDTSFLKIDPSRVWIGGGDIRNLLQGTLGGRTLLTFLRRSDVYYQALSTQSKLYLASWGFCSERIVYIPGSVDTEKFRPDPGRRPDPASPERTLICVARLDYSKGIDVLLHAWKRMLSTSSEWRVPLKPTLRLVGDGDLRPQLERMAVELNIQGSLEFLGARSDIVELLQQAWGFVLPSRNEGMPNALLEAMACGLPCVATRVSGSEDVITDGLSGMLVEPEEPAELARALRSLIEDTELAQRLGQEGRAAVVREYQLVHIVGRCLGLYRQLLSEKSGQPAET